MVGTLKFYTGIGSRETPPDICDLMTKIAELGFRDGFILRSGAADGADKAFEAGASNSKEIYLPWPGFNGHHSTLLPTPEAFELAKKHHPAWDKCKSGARKLHARNSHQVLGYRLITPSSAIICWTPNGEGGGGTGQAIRLAQAYSIPVNDLGNSITQALYRTCVEAGVFPLTMEK